MSAAGQAPIEPMVVVTAYQTSKVGDEERPGLILDYDSDGNVVGIELMNASERVENPFEYAVKG